MALLRATKLNKSSNNTDKPANKFYANLGIQLKDGTFVRLSNSIVIALDKVLEEQKSLSKTNEEWNKKQLLINRAIEELKGITSDLEEGQSALITEYEDVKVLPKLTFQITHASETPKELGEGQIASNDLIDELL